MGIEPTWTGLPPNTGFEDRAATRRAPLVTRPSYRTKTGVQSLSDRSGQLVRGERLLKEAHPVSDPVRGVLPSSA